MYLLLMQMQHPTTEGHWNLELRFEPQDGIGDRAPQRHQRCHIEMWHEQRRARYEARYCRRLAIHSQHSIDMECNHFRKALMQALLCSSYSLVLLTDGRQSRHRSTIVCCQPLCRSKRWCLMDWWIGGVVDIRIIGYDWEVVTRRVERIRQTMHELGHGLPAIRECDLVLFGKCIV
jgi:hypothetical protein